MLRDAYFIQLMWGTFLKLDDPKIVCTFIRQLDFNISCS